MLVQKSLETYFNTSRKYVNVLYSLFLTEPALLVWVFKQSFLLEEKSMLTPKCPYPRDRSRLNQSIKCLKPNNQESNQLERPSCKYMIIWYLSTNKLTMIILRTNIHQWLILKAWYHLMTPSHQLMPMFSFLVFEANEESTFWEWRDLENSQVSSGSRRFNFIK